MARQPRQHSSTGIYHVMARGIDHRRLFEEDADYARFLELTGIVRQISGASLLAYCLMSNHVHMVVEEHDEPVSQFFKRLGVRYAGWFNRKYQRAGHLFQDRFRSEPIHDDAYLVTVIRYVHMNPVTAGICDEPQHYRWSSAVRLHDDPLIDSHRLTELFPADDLLGGPPDGPTLPHRVGRRRAFTDDEVAAALVAWTSPATTSAFLTLPVDQQRHAITTLREHGVPIRQVARVTGISKGLVERWDRSSPPPTP